MKMSDETGCKRKNTDDNIDDKCQDPKKKRMETEDDIIIIEDDDKEEEDNAAVRQKFTKKCLLYVKKRKADITKLTHRELIGIFVDQFVETFTLNSTMQRLKRDLDEAYRTIELLKIQNRNMSKSITNFDKVLKRLNEDLKTRSGYVRPYVIQRSVGLQISTSNTPCDTNTSELQPRKGPEHFNENASAPNPQQNERIPTEQTENTGSPEIKSQTNKDTEVDENIGLDDWKSDVSPLGSPEQIPELDQQNSENEEPTEEKIVEQETSDETTGLPIEYLNSDEDSDSETEFEIFKEITTIAASVEIADSPSEIAMDDLGEVTVDEVIRVLSSCGLINPDENEVVNDNDMLNDLQENKKNREMVDDVLSVSCPKLIEYDNNQNVIQTELCDKTDFVCEVDARLQTEATQIHEVQNEEGNSEPTPDMPKENVDETKSLLVIPNKSQQGSPEQQQKEEEIQPPTNQPCTAEASLNPLPPPSLCGIKEDLDAVLTWAMPDGVNHESIASFEILYAFDEVKNERSEWKWKPIGVIENKDYPVMCKLGKFQAGRKYCFSVRAIDKEKRISPYSNVYKVEF